MYVYRWDLDKTYLDTDFDSIRGLIRSATEPAHEKRNVPGSGALMRSLSRHPNARIIILSGSPTQMRDVLAEKLRLDGVRYDELHLKDNLGNLKRGRFRAVRGQFGYKLPMLLRGRLGLGPAVRETLFGDDAEVDALVYSVFADAIAGRLRPSEVSRIMEAAGSYPDRIAEALEVLDRLGTSDAVDRVFIHLDRGVPTARFAPLGSRVVPVFSWFQAALVLHDLGRLDVSGVIEVAREVVDRSPTGARGLANHLQDIVRRGYAPITLVDRLAQAGWTDDAVPDFLPLARRRIDALHGLAVAPLPLIPPRINYLDLLRQFGRKESREDAG
ncbi:MAG: hypothetical protein H6739_03200 [Alphaproteobacteria bacterium]|nr:hypothetical protein [Alphaproteobacteria bacterium]